MAEASLFAEFADNPSPVAIPDTPSPAAVALPADWDNLRAEVAAERVRAPAPQLELPH